MDEDKLDRIDKVYKKDNLTKISNGKYLLFRKLNGSKSYFKLRQNIDLFEFEIDGDNIHLLSKDKSFGQHRIRTENIHNLLTYDINTIRKRYTYDFIALCVDCSGFEDDGYRRMTKDRLYQVILCDIVNGYYPHKTVKISDSSIELIEAEYEDKNLVEKLTKSMLEQ